MRVLYAQGKHTDLNSKKRGDDSYFFVLNTFKILHIIASSGLKNILTLKKEETWGIKKNLN